MSWNLADLFERVVDAVPTRVAIICEAERLTFTDLEAKANRLAHWFAERGVGPGTRVGLALTNNPEHIAAMFALFKLRAVPINLNLRYTADELHGLLDDADAAGVVHEGSHADLIHAAVEGLPAATLVVSATELRAASAQGDSTRPEAQRSNDDLYVLYTGGTTGQPRGVMWRHEDLVLGALDGLPTGLETVEDPVGRAAGFAQVRAVPTTVLPACPLTHGTAQWVTFRFLLTGATVLLDPTPSMCPKRIWDLVDAENVSRLAIVGDAVGRPLLDALDEEPDRWSLDSLVVIASGGAVLSPTVRAGLLRHLPGVAIVDGFGSSESGGHGRMVVFPGQAQPLDEGLVRFVPDDTTAVLDDGLQPLPIGSPTVGRLARRGPIPLGYLGDPERSAATFPEVEGVRWAIPGDLATIDADGRITVLGRDAATINTGGEKVFAEEVEVVLRSHPEVVDAIVVGVPDERWGSRVAAVVAIRPSTDGKSVTESQLQAHCRDHLAGFKVPRTLLLLGSVRRSDSGKADLAWARTMLLGSSR